MLTFYDMGVRESAESWRALRRRRSHPPVPADSALRAETFRSGLEQAEQQFRAAASVGYESRALNLYYGVSQAGRAIAASARTLGASDWQLVGHGLKAIDMQSISTDVSILALRRDGGERTSFERLSSVLGSPTHEALTLGELWPLMFETNLHAPLGKVLYRPLLVTLKHRAMLGAHGIDTAEIEIPNDSETDIAPVPRALPDFLDRYPALRGWVRQDPAGRAISWPGAGQNLVLQWHLDTEQALLQHLLDDRLTTYRNHQMAFPRLGSEEHPRHPLMLWWMALYGLSMLTRYQPATWTNLIDVNRSAQATAVEFVLDVALSAVPDLVDEAIDLVSEPC
jgi:hypothetical protein